MFKEKVTGNDVKADADFLPTSVIHVVATQDATKTSIRKKKSAAPASQHCTVIADTTKYFRCSTCNVSWVCESCIEGCHEGHSHAQISEVARPVWRVCLCFRSGECLHETQAHMQDEEWVELPCASETKLDDWEDSFVDTAGDTSGNVAGNHELHQSMIEEVRLAVERDVFEVNQSQTMKALADFSAIESNKFSIRLGMNVSSLRLSREQALAWYLSLDKMLVLQVDFSAYYLDAMTPPTISALGLADFLGGPIAPCRLSWTLKDRLKNIFLKRHMDKTPRPYEVEEVKSLMEITSESFLLCLLALQDKKGNIANATSMLTDHKRSFLDKISAVEGVELKVQTAGHAVHKPEKHAQDRERLCQIHHIDPVVAELVLNIEPNIEAALEMLLQPGVKEQFCAITKRSKRSESGTENFFCRTLSPHNILVRMLKFLFERLQTVNQSCLVCDEPLEYEGLRPDVCSKPLCVMSQETFGDLGSLAQEVREAPEVVDLLISFFMAAINANRLLFVTPTGVQIKNKDGSIHSYCDAKGNLDLPRMQASLSKLPSVADMQKLADRYELNEHLTKIDVLLIPLVRWIINSNRAHIRKLEPHECVKGMQAAHQFVMLSATPEKERKFRELRELTETSSKSKGSLWAFHGSSTGNWHSILRTGLKNLSNTKYMTAGAAHGAGVYLGRDSSTSLGYCGLVPGWKASQFGASFTCMALCEVLNRPSSFKTLANMYVVPDDDIVNTRFFFVSPAGGVNADSLDIPPLHTDQDRGED